MRKRNGSVFFSFNTQTLLGNALRDVLPSVCVHIYIYTRETLAFGGISLALWGSGAFGGVKRKINWGVRGAPLGAVAYAAFGGDRKNVGRLRRPKWF